MSNYVGVWGCWQGRITLVLSLVKTHFVLFLTAGATGQRLVARLSTGGDGIRAAPSLRVTQLQQFGQLRLTAGTRLHQARGARAQLARTAVALLLALVSFAVQHPERRKVSVRQRWELSNWRRMDIIRRRETYFPHNFWQEKCPEPSNPSLSVPHRASRVVTPQ